MIELRAVGIFHHGTFIFEGSIFRIGKLEPEIKMSFYVIRFDMTMSPKMDCITELSSSFITVVKLLEFPVNRVNTLLNTTKYTLKTTFLKIFIICLGLCDF